MNGKPAMPEQRKSNFELLRIVAILLIIAHHIAYHSGFQFPSSAISVNRLWVLFILVGGKIGVNLFMLVSGYFLISSKGVKASKALRLWVQIFTYAFVILLILSLAGIKRFSIRYLIRCVFPISFNIWWFASTYFVMYLLHPYLNKMLFSFSRMEYRRYLILLSVLWCLFPTLTRRQLESNHLLWFVFLYSLAGYYRLFCSENNWKARNCILFSVAILLLTFFSAVLLAVLGKRFSIFAGKEIWFYDMESLPIVVASVSMFIGFEKLKVRQSALINTVSSTAFGIYLIHDHGFVSTFLWKTLFKNAAYANSRLLIPYTLLELAVVFTACCLIELFRKAVLEKSCNGIFNRLGEGIIRLGTRAGKKKFIEKL